MDVLGFIKYKLHVCLKMFVCQDDCSTDLKSYDENSDYLANVKQLLLWAVTESVSAYNKFRSAIVNNTLQQTVLL